MWQLVAKNNSDVVFEEFYTQFAADEALHKYFKRIGNYDRMVINGD